MKSWKLTSQGSFELITTPSETPGFGQVKIKVEKTSISLPDLMIYMGKSKVDYPITLGRNCVGMIIETGPGVEDFKRGDKVYVCAKKYCGQCPACKSGHYFLCDDFKTFGYNTDGFMRDFAIIDASDCALLPERLDSNEAIFLDHISLATQVLTALKINKGEYVAISGCGLPGLILGEVALYLQAIPIMIDTDSKMLSLAKRLGIYYTINSTETNPEEKIFHITGGKMAKHSAVFTSGNISVEQALSFAGIGARIAVVERPGIVTKQKCGIDIIQNNCLSLFGVNGGPNIQISINMLVNRAIDLSTLSEMNVRIDEIPDIMKELAESTRKYHLQYIVDI